MKYIPVWITALVLGILAPVSRFWLAPIMLAIPEDYFSEVSYDAESEFRPALDEPWKKSRPIAKRSDQVITAGPGHVMIQGILDWSLPTGEVLFLNKGLYGVDRRTGGNVTGLGDAERLGQYLFPPRFRKTSFQLWDPLFIGPRQTEFLRVEKREGLDINVYRFEARKLDETAGYGALPDVPERFKVFSEGDGFIWIESESGVMLDYKGTGISYFMDPVTHMRQGDIMIWKDSFSPETKGAQWVRALRERGRVRFWNLWLPGTLLFAALTLMVLAAGAAYRSRIRPTGVAA